MAITTVQGLIDNSRYPRQIVKAGVGTYATGRLHTLWAANGMPAAGTYDTTLNGVTLSAPTTGGITFENPVSGKTYLSLFRGQTLTTATAVLADRLWHNGGIDATSTLAQSITSPTWPARDISGSTNGDGVFLAVEVSAAVGAGTPTITVSYTNEAGTSGRTGTNIETTVANSAIGAVYRIGLQAGDKGVRSVQSLTLSATWTSGTINLVAYRPIAMIAASQLVSTIEDAVTLGAPVLHDGSVPYFMLGMAAIVSSTLMGQLQFSQG